MLELFTIVLNGMPYVAEHKAIFDKLSIPWRWHIVEGVAKNIHCTNWCREALPEDHDNWLSRDGTTQYLDSIASKQILIYRKSTPGPWQGKLEMCNAPLANIEPGAVLHEVDVDEFWTRIQLETIHDLFTKQGGGRGSYYCDGFFGPDIHVLNMVEWARSIGYPWIRTHRYAGKAWTRHEPPEIPFSGRDVGWDETRSMGLVFPHFAYSTEAQIRFKENYYNMPNLLKNWRALQAHVHFPINLKLYLNYWSFDGIVEKTDFYADIIKKVQAT